MSDDLMKEAKQLLNSISTENTKWYKLVEPVSKLVESQFKPNVYYYSYGLYPDDSSKVTINNEEYQVLHYKHIDLSRPRPRPIPGLERQLDGHVLNKLLPNELILIIESYIGYDFSQIFDNDNVLGKTVFSNFFGTEN